MDVLSGRINYKGSYTMNGKPVTSDAIRSKSAYVQQEDMFFPYLTVREHMWYQAQLRLSSSMPLAAKQGVCSFFGHVAPPLLVNGR